MPFMHYIQVVLTYIYKDNNIYEWTAQGGEVEKSDWPSTGPVGLLMICTALGWNIIRFLL